MSSTATRRPIVLTLLGVLVTLALLASPQIVPQAIAGGDGSGSKAVAHKAGFGKAPKSAAKKGPDAKLFRLGLNAGEPTLGLTKNGDIFYTAIQSNTRVEILRSQNEGEKWEIVSPKLGNRNAQLLTLDPYVWVDPYTDRIFTIDLTLACAYMSYSDDQGASWITNPLACGRPVNDHQTLFSGPPVSSPTVGYENLVYYCWNDIGSSSCTKSIDGGLTFTSTGEPAFVGATVDGGDQGGPRSCGGLHGHGHVDSKGTVYLPRGYCGQPYVAISQDEGATWERVQVSNIGIEGHEASISSDPKGNLYYLWVAPDRLPYLSVSKNGGRKWSKPLMVAPPGLTESNLPSLDAGGVGKIAITYMGSENSPYKPPRRGGEGGGGECTATSSCGGDNAYKNTTWNGYMTVSANALDKSPTFYTTTVNDKKDPLKRGECGPGRCGTGIYDFIDIVIGPKGDVYGAFVDACISICGSAQGASDMGADAVVGRLVGGPNLR